MPQAEGSGIWQHYSIRDGLPDMKIECLFTDSRGMLWIGTHDRGAVRFARVVQIHFADGCSLNFVDLSEPVAADSAGDTSGVRAKKGYRLRMLPDE